MLAIGTLAADGGLTKAVYDQLDALLAPSLQKSVDEATPEARPAAQQALDAARDGWKKLAFAVASGVVGHLVDNLEVIGVQTAGNVAAAVSGQVAVQNGVVFTQSNNGTGHVR